MFDVTFNVSTTTFSTLQMF